LEGHLEERDLAVLKLRKAAQQPLKLLVARMRGYPAQAFPVVVLEAVVARLILQLFLAQAP